MLETLTPIERPNPKRNLTMPDVDDTMIPGSDEVELDQSFKQEMQNGYDGQQGDPTCFAMIKREMFDEMGGAIHPQGLNTAPLLLANLLARQKRQLGETQVEYESCDDTADVGEKEFVYTKEGATRDILAMLGITDRDRLYTEQGAQKGLMKTHYQRQRNHWRKITSRDLAWSDRKAVPKRSECLGTVWDTAMSAEQVRNRRMCDASGGVDMDLDEEEVVDHYTEDGLVDVIKVYKVLMRKYEPTKFMYSETCFSVEQRGTYQDFQEWMERHAEDECGADNEYDDQSRHQSVGAWREEATQRDVGAVRSDPVTVPWVILEVEDGGLLERWERTHRLLSTLDEELGADLDTIQVTYSGNQSFHVRIPCGQFASPVFENADVAEDLLNRFVTRHFTSTIDRHLLDPFHLVRTPGSRHETGFYVTTYDALTFLDKSLKSITDEAQEHQATSLPDPYHVEASGLRSSFQETVERKEEHWIPAFEDIDRSERDGTGTVIREIEDGVGKGESFQGRGKVHSGRNKATFIMACFFLEQYSEREALRRTEAYAKKHSPPLGDHAEDSRNEYKKCFESAKRTV